MENPIPYEGREPYVFLSYAHADAEAVMEIAARLQKAGCRIWYDGGIEVGSEWPEYIASHLEGAAVMLAFLSNAYVRSDNCRKELHFAQTKRISTVNIFLEETALTPGMQMQIGPLFALMKYTMPETAFYEKLLTAPQLTPLCTEKSGGGPAQVPPRPQKTGKKRRWTWQRITLLSVASVLLIACVTLGIIAWATGYAQRFYISRHQAEIVSPPWETEITFTSPALEQIARDYSGTAEGKLTVSDLAGLTELSLADADAAALRELQYFPSLRKLTLTGLRAEDLQALPACPVETLILRDSFLSSLKGIGKLTLLRELECESCPVQSLGDLSWCLQLRRLRLAGTEVRSLSALRTLTMLAEAEISGCGINELRPLFGLERLTDLRFIDCDLRGSFFKRFDREWDIVTLSLVDCKLNSTKNLEDFQGLRELTLIRSGEKLDWSALANLPSLRLVTADESMAEVLREALKGSGNLAELTIIKDKEEAA